MHMIYSSFLLFTLLIIFSNSVKGAQTTGNSSSKSGSKTSGAGQNALTPTTRSGPMIDKPSSKNVTALLGKTAYLNCKVKNLGNKTISWVRHRDIHLLTVGRYTYTSDQRFRAIHHAGTEDWSLQIKYPQHRDSGIYECQISTTPHMSHFIHLNVVEPTTDIIGGPDLYIDRGSTINLTCVVLFSPEPPAYIFWNHNDAIISYDSPRGGVSVITEKGETTTSFLLIQHARPSDSGRYQCNPSNAQSKSVNVHVLNEEDYGPSTTEMSPLETSETETSEAGITEEVTTDAVISTTNLPDFSSKYYKVSKTIENVIRDLEETTTIDESEEKLVDESSTLVENDYYVDSTTDDYESTTMDPDNENRGVSIGGQNTAMLMSMMYLLAQFPAAMQHGGQAHHRSSHLYCLIFCVCLLLFST